MSALSHFRAYIRYMVNSVYNLLSIELSFLAGDGYMSKSIS